MTLPGPSPDRPPRLYFTVGVQRSGKSTEARRWLRRQPNRVEPVDDGFPRFLWDTDFLRLALHGDRYHREAEPMAFAIKNYAIRAALLAGHDVCVAGTHTSRTSIRRLLEIDPGAIPVVVDTPVETCLRRAIDTGQPDLVPVIARAHEQLRDLLDFGVVPTIDAILADMDAKVPY